MNPITVYQLRSTLNYCRTRIKGILSDIEFDEICVTPETKMKLEELYQKVEPMLTRTSEANNQTRLNLTSDEQILYDDIVKIVADFDEGDD